MESEKPKDENGESKRTDCSLAGGAWGVLSAFFTFMIAYVPEISWHIVHGWSKAVPWIVDSDLAFRLALGIILGVGIGVAVKRRPRVAFWMSAAVSFLACYLFAPRLSRLCE